MADPPAPNAPHKRRFAILTQHTPASVERICGSLWTVQLNDGAEPARIQITDQMLWACLDPRARMAVEEIIESERRQPEPHRLVTQFAIPTEETPT